MTSTFLIAAVLTTGMLDSHAETPGVDATFASESSPRLEKPFSLGAEIGYNALGGNGLAFSYDFHPHWSMDAAAGWSRVGPKLGVRGRYNFSARRLTPFVGAGFSVGTGTLFGPITEEGQPLPVTYSIDVSPFAQAVGGLSYRTESGVALSLTAGWSQLLRGKNLRWHVAPSPQQREDIAPGVNSGPVLSVAAGYAF